jgi:RimJ/RimL family protein N-acetyltransferase
LTVPLIDREIRLMLQPTLRSKRLILRPFCADDAPTVQRLASDRYIADTTNIPHPYENGMAEKWIETHQIGFDSGALATFAVVLRDCTQLIGAVGLRIGKDRSTGVLGYWVGRPYWNRGYATEAATAILDFGFNELKLSKISAAHIPRNPSSGRVLEKVGMLFEKIVHQGTMKWGQYEDLIWYSILRDNWTPG